MSNVVNIDGSSHDTSNTQTTPKGMLESLALEEAHKYSGAVVILVDTKGKLPHNIAWVGLTPLEVVGTLAHSESMIIGGKK